VESIRIHSARCAAPLTTITLPKKDPNGTSGLTCECDTVMYSLYMACSNCQGGSIASWTDWIVNCDNVAVAQYPHDIPPGTAVPHWAYCNVTTLPNQTYSDFVAMALGRDPEAKPTSSSGKKNNTGAIAGGVVGGVMVLLVLALVVAFIIRRRKRGGGQQPPHRQETSEDSEGKSPFPDFTENFSPTSADPPRNVTYYDPDDPTTFPPPMEEIESPETLVDGHTTPSQGQSQSLSITGM